MVLLQDAFYKMVTALQVPHTKADYTLWPPGYDDGTTPRDAAEQGETPDEEVHDG